MLILDLFNNFSSIVYVSEKGIDLTVHKPYIQCPDDGVAVTQAFINPLALIPLGNLTPGDYVVEVHINTYILTFDDQGNPIYTLLQTFKVEMWTLTFTIE